MSTDSLSKLSDRIGVNEYKLGGIDTTVKDAIESAKNEVIYYTDETKSDLTSAYKEADDVLDKKITDEVKTLNETIDGNKNEVETTIDDAKKELKEYTDTAKTDAISTAAADATSKANTAKSEALTAAKGYTDAEIEKLETTVGQPATTGENGEVIHNATGIFKVIVDYKTSIDKLDGTIDNLNEVVNSYKDHVETYTDETIGKIANDKISELVGTESTEESAATGVFARINTVESSINTLNASNTTDGSIAKAISDATTTINARIEALEEHHDFTVTLKDDISSTGEQMYSFTVKAGTIYAAVSDTECEIYTDEAMQNKLCSVAANEQKLFKAKEDSTYYVKTNIEIY